MRRFDSNALYQALDAKRIARGLTWTQVAEQSGVSVFTLRGTERGGRLEVDGMLAMVDWVGLSVETFVREVAR